MAIVSLQTNDNNDLYLVDGRNLGVISGIDALTQDIRLACLMRTGEDLYNVNAGIDFFGTIFTPQQNFDKARASISATILSFKDVLSINSLEITINGNTFNFTANISTIYGSATVSN